MTWEECTPLIGCRVLKSLSINLKFSLIMLVEYL